VSLSLHPRNSPTESIQLRNQCPFSASRVPASDAILKVCMIPVYSSDSSIAGFQCTRFSESARFLRSIGERKATLESLGSGKFKKVAVGVSSNSVSRTLRRGTKFESVKSGSAIARASKYSASRGPDDKSNVAFCADSRRLHTKNDNNKSSADLFSKTFSRNDFLASPDKKQDEPPEAGRAELGKIAVTAL
jgi:hypothetical protein